MESAPEAQRFSPAVSVAITWTCAGLAVYAVEFGSRGLFAGAAHEGIAFGKIAVIVGAGAIYARTASGAPSGFVLTSGIAWLVFSIAADIITGIGSTGAYQLLGDPTAVSGLLRTLTMLAWLSAPALFARGGATTERREDYWQ
jgi:hypothetical protein